MSNEDMNKAIGWIATLFLSAFLWFVIASVWQGLRNDRRVIDIIADTNIVNKITNDQRTWY